MKRFAANLVYCSPTKILKNGVIEIDDHTGNIIDIFSLDVVGDEIQSTAFFNGILLPFQPAFKPEMQDEDIFRQLEVQFKEKNIPEIYCNEKIHFWLLEGNSLFTTKTPGNNWKTRLII